MLTDMLTDMLTYKLTDKLTEKLYIISLDKIHEFKANPYSIDWLTDMLTDNLTDVMTDMRKCLNCGHMLNFGGMGECSSPLPLAVTVF